MWVCKRWCGTRPASSATPAFNEGRNCIHLQHTHPGYIKRSSSRREYTMPPGYFNTLMSSQTKSSHQLYKIRFLSAKELMSAQLHHTYRQKQQSCQAPANKNLFLAFTTTAAALVQQKNRLLGITQFCNYTLKGFWIKFNLIRTSRWDHINPVHGRWCSQLSQPLVGGQPGQHSSFTFTACTGR